MTKLIPLTQGKFAQVDDDLFDQLSPFKWYTLRRDGKFYAARKATIENRRRKTIYLHHAVIGDPPDGCLTDHVDGDGLNNQRHNLRHTTHSVNALNTGALGVFWNKARHKWRAQITINGIKVHLGQFEDVSEAIRVRDEAKENYIWWVSSGGFSPYTE